MFRPHCSKIGFGFGFVLVLDSISGLEASLHILFSDRWLHCFLVPFSFSVARFGLRPGLQLLLLSGFAVQPFNINLDILCVKY